MEGTLDPNPITFKDSGVSAFVFFFCVRGGFKKTTTKNNGVAFCFPYFPEVFLFFVDKNGRKPLEKSGKTLTTIFRKARATICDHPKTP